MDDSKEKIQRYNELKKRINENYSKMEEETKIMCEKVNKLYYDLQMFLNDNSRLDRNDL